MKKTMLKTLSLVAVMIVAALMLGACGAAATAEPTVDPNVIFTQVAETVMVSMTQTAEAMPPTATPEPTATIAPTPTTEPTPEGTQDQQQPQTAPTISMGPTATVQLYGDVARWQTQSPLDGKIFKIGEEYTFHVCMLNVGSTDWNSSFSLRYIDGYKTCWNNKVNVGDNVEPGDKWCFDLGCTAPYSAGSYTTYWYMYDDDGNKVLNSEVYFSYKAE
ncbi:MAG: hypothetical protein PWQ55_2126 [Chloroflexota bacterium]|nr:hypothetical protein [Chloroflexota bacterium]